MENLDTRVQFTRTTLKNTILHLLLEKPISKISVKELCTKAGLNRGTFYLHYSSPEELLNEIQYDFLKENQTIFENYWNQERDVDIMTEIFDCISRNRDVCKVIMGNNGNLYFMDNIKEMMRDRILTEWQKEFPNYNRNDLTFLFEFIFTGSMRLILDWIDDDQGISASEFTKRLERLGHHCLLALREFK